MNNFHGFVSFFLKRAFLVFCERARIKILCMYNSRRCGLFGKILLKNRNKTAKDGEKKLQNRNGFWIMETPGYFFSGLELLFWLCAKPFTSIHTLFH